MGTAIRPSLSALSRYKVLPPDPEDIDRLIQIQRAQNTRDTWDENLAGGLIGALEGFTGTGDFSNVRALRGSRDYGNFLGQAVSSKPNMKIAPMMGVAFGAGKAGGIAHQRMQGARNVEKVIQEGLEHRSLGMRPQTKESLTRRAGDPIIYQPNKPLNESALSALSIAQQRWPRLMGHFTDIADVDAAVSLANMPGKTTGSVMGTSLKDPKAYKLGRLGLSEDTAPSTVGHEALHLKDRILDKDFVAKYMRDKQDPNIGYKKMTQEKRADAMGQRFQEIVDEIENLGGRAKTPEGRNIRVPKLRTQYTGEKKKLVHPDDAEVDYQLRKGRTLEEAYSIVDTKHRLKAESDASLAEVSRKLAELKKRLGIK